jgi:diaminopimelate decarboxylase
VSGRQIDIAAVAPECVPIGDRGVTTIDGLRFADLAERFGTPLWIVSRSQLERNFQTLSDALAADHEHFEVAYSMKANNDRGVIQALVACGALIDCSSEHEIEIARLAGVAPERLIANGNGKSDRYLESVVGLGVHQVNVDSIAEVRRLARLAAAHRTQVSCVVRLKLSYQRLLAQDPSYERTLRVAEGKFGSSVTDGEAVQVVAELHKDPWLSYSGISHHAGFSGYRADYTPERQLMHIEECARELAAFAVELQREHRIPTERIDVGGGLRSGPSILLATPGAGGDAALHPLPSPEEYSGRIAAGFSSAGFDSGPPVLQLETGGFQVGNAVVLLTRVLDVKDVSHLSRRRFVTIDASIVTRALTRVGFPVAVIGSPPAQSPADIPVELVGPTCAYDSLAEDIALPDLECGDLIVLFGQGAYCETMSTQFNGFPRPAVALVEDGDAILLRRRESVDDIVARDLGLASAPTVAQPAVER